MNEKQFTLIVMVKKASVRMYSVSKAEENIKWMALGNGKHNILGIETIISNKNRKILKTSQVSSVTRTQ